MKSGGHIVTHSTFLGGDVHEDSCNFLGLKEFRAAVYGTAGGFVAGPLLTWGLYELSGRNFDNQYISTVTEAIRTYYPFVGVGITLLTAFAGRLIGGRVGKALDNRVIAEKG